MNQYNSSNQSQGTTPAAGCGLFVIILVLIGAFTKGLIGGSQTLQAHDDVVWTIAVIASMILTVLCLGADSIARMKKQENNIDCESPIEELFWDAAKDQIKGLVSQYQIGIYRVDFAIPEKQIAIELDGHEYHSTKAQRTADARRERALQEKGWTVIRFTGTEIYTNVYECVEQTKRICVN